MYEQVLYAVDGGIATLTLNRPEKRNAYTVRMGEELMDAFRRARDDAAVRAIVLTGAGRGFCAGVDLDALRAHQAGGGPSAGPRLGEEAFTRSFPLELRSFPKPVVAAFHGAAIGVGVTMTLPCDARIAAEDATFGVTFTTSHSSRTVSSAKTGRRKRTQNSRPTIAPLREKCDAVNPSSSAVVWVPLAMRRP